MKIERIEVTCLNVPSIVPFLNRATSLGLVLAVVHTDEGIAGIGLSRAVQRRAVAEILTGELATFLLGRNPLEIERIWKDAFIELGTMYQLRTGLLAFAMSAIDQAMWDIKGKSANQPIFRLLGGASDTIDCYTTFGLAALTEEELVAAARQLVDAGHNKLKMLLIAARHGVGVHKDAERVQAVRKAVGPDIQIMLDANCTLSITEAMKLCRMVEDYDITFIEDPVGAKDLRALADLRRSSSVPVAARPRGENIWDARDMIVSGAVDYMQLNVIDSGGYSECLKMGHMAEMYQIPVATGAGHYLPNAHLLAGLRNGSVTENHLVLDSIWDKIFIGAPQPQNGQIKLSDAPGLGVELNKAAIEEFADIFKSEGDRDLQTQKQRMNRTLAN